MTGGEVIGLKAALWKVEDVVFFCWIWISRFCFSCINFLPYSLSFMFFALASWTFWFPWVTAPFNSSTFCFAFLKKEWKHMKTCVWSSLYSKALPDITFGPEVLQIFKIRTVRKPDVFLPGRRNFNSFKNRNKIDFYYKNPKNFRFFFRDFLSRFFFVYLFGLRILDTKFVSRDLILWEFINHTC